MKIKRSVYLYTRVMWYMTQAKGVITQPLQFWNETLLILTFLAVKGINVSAFWAAVAYLVFFTIVTVMGVAIVRLGFIKYHIQLGNTQNPEILEILDTVKAIEKRLND